MRRSPLTLHFLASATTTDSTAMSSRRPPNRGGRIQGWKRFSDRPYEGGGRGQLLTGQSHFQSVQEANLGFRLGDQGGSSSNQPPYLNQRPLPPFNHNPWFRRPPPFDRNQSFRQPLPPPFSQNQAFRPPQQSHPRRQKPLDYRNWEYSKTAPPHNCEKFVVLSYNILADYLALNHRSKLYFHIPRYMLDWEWRKRNIMFELGLWSADIMCFQEVDRFEDLDLELKLRGYNGIWKMRTGSAIDGCAIFWRTSRFKLVHEECIEFNKLGLRDNVAQICVFELLSQNHAVNVATPTSSAASNRVVICNIHVLYNPKRGDFKLGQVRLLLDKAHVVSKIWNNAPLVLCGDFNCTPKSPLYNFILEQKLDLFGVDRDKVSGQASAEIRAPRTQSSYTSTQAPSSEDGKEVGIKLSDYLRDVQSENNSNCNVLNLPVNNLPQLQCIETVLEVSNKSCTDVQCGNEVHALCDNLNKETEQPAIDGSKANIGLAPFVPIDSSKGSSSCLSSEGGFPTDQMNDEVYKFAPSVASSVEDVYYDITEMGYGGKDKVTSLSNQGSLSEHSDSNINTENENTEYDNPSRGRVSDNHSTRTRFNPEFRNAFNLELSSAEVFGQTSSLDAVEISPPGNSESLSSQLIVNDENCGPSVPYQANISSVYADTDFELDKKLDNLYIKDPSNIREGEGMSEDDKSFLSALHDNDDAFPSDFGKFVRSDLDHSSKEFASSPQNPQLNSSSDEVLRDFSPALDSEAINVEKSTYDPSLWTPMEVEIATGNPDSTLLEHPLQLKSTYTEVEDSSKTRDSNGEPLVTSYNRCFMGTVDYILRSKGLQTVRVLAPIPEHAMQWTPGFPTKKWGSDHIALASELAIIRDPIDSDTR